ncbi:PA14 domain-containing protein [Pleionea sediminis]|uniref:PA14 domain-containing protein n=1 Tax=Pleionea sediminis TaxID=2569479 RepID=UPI0013DDABA4|nr:PA14 domain-containing protein [Pleionea sediminis]
MVLSGTFQGFTEVMKKVFLLFILSGMLTACGGSDTDEENTNNGDDDDTPEVIDSGLWAHKYNGSWTQVPDFTTLTAESSEVVGTVGTHNLGETNYGLVLSGLITLETAGNYRFHLNSDDGSKLYIDGQLITDNDGTHSAETIISEPISLQQGEHELRVEYFQGRGSQTLSLSYQLNSGSVDLVPSTALSHTDDHQDPNYGAVTDDTGDDDSDDGTDDDTGNDDTNNLITLPVEVLGPEGTTQSVSFELTDPSAITHLYLRCNSCGYHDIDLDKNTNKIKATVRVNGGNAISLKHFTEKGNVYGNSEIDIIGGEANYGAAGGGFRTVRMKLPINGLVAGENTLTFEHRDFGAPSIGFRIIELNLLENNDLNQKVFADNAFQDDDPTDWTPPRNTTSDINQGAALWRERNKLYDPWLDSLDGDGNGQGSMSGDMRASCADCHAEDGRDLKYFNFSNRSIIERSKFHGLSQEESEQVASYIRSLDIPLVEQARPWHPTYQPGANLDDRPVYEWAAGAGIDAILDRDDQIESYLFPNGTSDAAVKAVVDRYATLNFRELPMTIPMPEWNQWLPIIHPDDAFDISASAIRSDYDGRDVGMPYYKKLYNDAIANPNPETIGALAKDVKRWLRSGLTCQQGEPMRAINGDILRTIRLPMPSVNWNDCDDIETSDTALEIIEIAKRGLTGWTSVKMWEVMHSNNLEEASQTQNQSVCSDGRCIDASEARGWVAEGRNVFDRAPHFIGTGGGRKFFTQSEMLGIFESNSWYHLNMILNPGYRNSMPSHFAYTYSHVELLQRYSDIDQGFRFWATMIKQRQLQTNGKYGVEAGLDLRTAQPYVYFGTARRTTNTDAQSSVGNTLWRKLINAMLEDFVADADNATAEDWANANQNRKVQPRDSTDFSGCDGTCSFELGPYQGKNTYRVIPEFRNLGVDESILQDLIDWCEKTWPRGPWDNIR